MNEKILESIHDALITIKNRLYKPNPDSRLFLPDETCTPFFLSTSLASVQNSELLAWKIPDSQRGVIHTIIAIGGGGIDKINSKLVLYKGQVAVIDAIHESTTGALHNVFETGSNAGDNVSGIPILSSTAGARMEARIKLDAGGDYRLVKQSSAGASYIYVALFGWTWPNYFKA